MRYVSLAILCIFSLILGIYKQVQYGFGINWYKVLIPFAFVAILMLFGRRIDRKLYEKKRKTLRRLKWYD